MTDAQILNRLENKARRKMKTKNPHLSNCLELDLSKLINKRIPRNQKSKRVKEIILKIKQLQQENNITEFQRDFLNTLLNVYTNIDDRKRQLIIKEVLRYAKKREGIIKKTYLINDKSDFGVQEVKRKEFFMNTTFYTFI